MINGITMALWYLPYTEESRPKLWESAQRDDDRMISESGHWISATPLLVAGYPFIKAVDWYKRLYNDAATLYNLWAANVNHFMTQRKLNKNGRKIGEVPAEVILEEYVPDEPKPLPVDWLTPAPRKDGLKPAQQNNNDVKKIIVDALQKLQNNWWIAKNVEAAKKLIDLYKVATGTAQPKQEVKPKQFLVGTDWRMIAEIVD